MAKHQKRNTSTNGNTEPEPSFKADFGTQRTLLEQGASHRTHIGVTFKALAETIRVRRGGDALRRSGVGRNAMPPYEAPTTAEDTVVVPKLVQDVALRVEGIVPPSDREQLMRAGAQSNDEVHIIAHTPADHDHADV